MGNKLPKIDLYPLYISVLYKPILIKLYERLLIILLYDHTNFQNNYSSYTKVADRQT